MSALQGFALVALDRVGIMQRQEVQNPTDQLYRDLTFIENPFRAFVNGFDRDSLAHVQSS